MVVWLCTEHTLIRRNAGAVDSRAQDRIAELQHATQLRTNHGSDDHGPSRRLKYMDDDRVIV